MSTVLTPTPNPIPTSVEDPAAQCPIDHAASSTRKTARVSEPADRPIERAAAGVWHVRGFEEARAVLRSTDTKQAGFKADLLERLPTAMKLPILYQEGAAHHAQRKQTARFFTPKTVDARYRDLMEALSDQLIDELKRTQRADLSQLTLALAVQVAGQVVGLTSSRVSGMDRRLNAFLEGAVADFGWRPRVLASYVRSQLRVAAFYFLDVRPAIRDRRRQPQEDVISHLIEQGYHDAEILTECVTYGAAGMVTTREFICVAAWHFLERPALRQRFVAAPEPERHAMLQEVLRLEPVVGHLYRRATADMRLEREGGPAIIRQGDLIDIHVYATNADETVAGNQPLALCPGRTLQVDRAAPSLLGFGDGHHRCPGSFVAIQETDIFLRRLLALDGLRMERAPTVTWNDLVTGYELRDFAVALD